MGCCFSRDYDFGLKDKSAVSPTPTLNKRVEKFDTLGRKSNAASTIESTYSNDRDELNRFPQNVRVQKSLAKKISSASQQTCDTISNRSHTSEEGSTLGSVELSFAKTDEESISARDSGKNSTIGENSTIGNNSTIGSLPRIGARKNREYIFSRLGSRRASLTLTKEHTTDTESMCSDEPEEILHWKKGNKLGSGSFGTVFLGLTDIGELIAVKQIDISSADFMEAEKEYDKIYTEVTFLKSLKHVNIVQYLGSTFEDNTISIFTQFVSGGSLLSIIQKFGPLEEPITSRYTKQLLDAVCYMHENHVVHRDIKSANIMLMPEGVLKLIDFGCARKLVLRLSNTGSQLMKSLKGTPYWMAPEVINESGHGKKSDIWSLGCTVYEMLTGKPPWGDREPFAAIYAIGSEDIPMPALPEKFAEKSKDFVKFCLIRDKRKRPTASKLKQHTFVLHVPEKQTSYESQMSEDGRWVENTHDYHL